MKIITPTGNLVAIVAFSTARTNLGLDFLTESGAPLQLAVMSHPDGHVIPRHTHREWEREVSETHEALFVQRGAILVTFYEGGWESTTMLLPSDAMLLCGGEHGIEFVGDVQVVEVKQGPYVSREVDKT